MHIWKNLMVLVLPLFVVLVSTAGCTSMAPTSMGPTKQPEPGRPLIKGLISGLSNPADLVTFRVCKQAGREVLWGTRPGNGQWEAVISNYSEGTTYTVTAEVKGYVSQPKSYTIHIIGRTAHVVQDNQVGEEALALNFHFDPLTK